MKELNNYIRKIDNAIANTVNYIEENENIKEYLIESYGYKVDDTEDTKQLVAALLEEYYYAEWSSALWLKKIIFVKFNIEEIKSRFIAYSFSIAIWANLWNS